MSYAHAVLVLYCYRFHEPQKPASADLGTPVFSNIVFEPGSFIPLDGGDPISYQGIDLDTVLITVSQGKNIITTNIQGKSGTVKEYVSDSDFIINVQGVLTVTCPVSFE